jgi:hypothetical protein
MGKAGQELLQAQRAFFSWCLQAGRRRIKNFCMPSSTSSLRWLNTVERSVTTAGAAAGDQLDHFERGIEGVAGIDRLQKPARLFEESDRRFLDDVGKQPGTRRGMDQGADGPHYGGSRSPRPRLSGSGGSAGKRIGCGNVVFATCLASCGAAILVPIRRNTTPLLVPPAGMPPRA